MNSSRNCSVFKKIGKTLPSQNLLRPWQKTLRLRNGLTENIKSSISQLKCDLRVKISRSFIKISLRTKMVLYRPSQLNVGERCCFQVP